MDRERMCNWTVRSTQLLLHESSMDFVKDEHNHWSYHGTLIR